MPRRIALKTGAALLLGAIATMFVFHARMKPGQTELASVADINFNGKALSLKPTANIIKHTYKLRPAFTVRLSNPSQETLEPRVESGQISENEDPTQALAVGAHFTLEAKFETTLPFAELQYEWLLPEGVTITGGSSNKGVIRNLTSREGAQISAHFINGRAENMKIHLRVWAAGDAQNLSYTTQYNTQLQSRLDRDQKELALRQDEYLLNNPESARNFK